MTTGGRGETDHLRGVDPRDLIDASFAASADAAVIVDTRGTIVLASPAVTALFGYAPEELAGLSIEVLVPDTAKEMHPTHRKRFVEAAQARHMGSGLQLHGRTRDGRDVPVDVSLAPIHVAGVQFSLALVRDATERVRSMRQAEAVSEITELLLSGASHEAALALILDRARALAACSAAWIVVSQPGGALKVVATDGSGVQALLGSELSPTSRAGRVVAERVVDVVDLGFADAVPAGIRALGLGPAVYVPLGGEDAETLGVLVVARAADAAPFDDFDVNLVRVFAATAAVALRTGVARRTAESMRLLAEKERIGSFLLDGSIQEAFQIGLILAAVRPIAAPAVAARLDEATERLDTLIRNIRTAIFHSGEQQASRTAEEP